MKPLTTGERLLVNKAYWSVIVRKEVFDAYWVDTGRYVSVRRVAGRRKMALPAGAVHFGRYDPSVTFEQFLGDLVDTLAIAEAA